MRTAAGLLLAAGAGRRMGRPKALLRHPAGEVTLLEHGIGVLRAAGCSPVVAVLGASADEALPLALQADEVVVAADWAEGQSASLRAGLEALAATAADAAVVMLVDLPDVDDRVVRRLLAAAPSHQRSALVRAGFDGRPGHPVVIGRAHWADIVATVAGDSGARDYLAAHHAALVECSDLATGEDLDVPADL